MSGQFDDEDKRRTILLFHLEPANALFWKDNRIMGERREEENTLRTHDGRKGAEHVREIRKWRRKRRDYIK